MAIKKHTINGISYKIDFTDRIDGVTETKDIPESCSILALDGVSLRAFHSLFHEALEANGSCSECLHNPDGTFRTWEPANLCWRWINEHFVRLGAKE